MSKIKSLYILLLCFCFAFAGKSQNFEYIENKGQWDSRVHYQGSLHSGAFFIQNNGYRVLQYDTSELRTVQNRLTGHGQQSSENTNTRNLRKSAPGKLPDDETVRAHAYEVKFAGANGKVFPTPSKTVTGYSNYFIGNDPSKWASNVKSYNTVTYSNMYNGVDVVYYSDNGFLKFDIVVKPNVNVGNIAMEYNGIEKLTLKNGALIIKTSVSEIKESKPYAYQVINGQRVEVQCNYELFGNTVKYKMGKYDPSATLVIDPTLIFSTFTGSQSDNWGYTATYDKHGNAYGGGIVFGPNYPTTVGAFQRSFSGGVNTGENGGFDINITKFNQNGSARVYSTFLGGSGNEQPHSLIVDNDDNLIVAGRTNSVTYPNTSRYGSLGGWDIVITKFNAAGTALIGSAIIGGSGDDGVNIRHKYTGGVRMESLARNYGDDARSEVLIDGSNNIYLASCTRSNNFPTTPGAIQTTLRGNQDAIVLKFNSNLSTNIFSTLIGGASDDAAYVIALRGSDIYIGGGTISTDFPGDKSGTVGPAYFGGECDGFIAKINSTATSILKSAYVGTDGADQVYGIQFDANDNFYVMGTSTGDFPVSNVAFSQAGGKQFVGKMPNTFSNYIFSTVWGTRSSAPNISPIAFLVDKCENMYISGWGGNIGAGPPNFANSGTRGLTVTSDALQQTTDGSDFYFIVLERDAASLLYATYFGQLSASGTPDHVDGGTSRFDANGVVYQAVCANCSSGQFPITPGVIGPTNGSQGCNEAVFKISFDLSGIRNGVKPTIDNQYGRNWGCVPSTVYFIDTVGMGKEYIWDFGDGSPQVTTTIRETNHTYTVVGDYTVRLITIDETRCFPRDTSYTNIRIRSDRAVLGAVANKLPPCESLQYEFINQTTIPPGKTVTENSFTWIFGDGSQPVNAGLNSVTHRYATTGTYDAMLILNDTNFCNAPDTFRLRIRVSDNVKAAIETPAIACAPSTVFFNNTSIGGATFLWTFHDGTTSTEESPSKFYGTPGVYSVKLVVRDPNTCNEVDSVTINLSVYDKPTAAFIYSPNPPQENVTTTFENRSLNATSYEWIFGDGDTLRTTSYVPFVHPYRRTGTYIACLIAFNQFGCSDTVCQEIQITGTPVIDVVSAFTPNNDGKNDLAKVLAFGVQKLMFKIYNRWGQLMFETNDDRYGWDGNYKGTPQPMDAYGYVLEAVMQDGQNVKKSGSITLIR